ncbi:glycosyltransferase [Thermoproteota archaeon]
MAVVLLVSLYFALLIIQESLGLSLLAVYHYFRYCINSIFERSVLFIFVLFAPALLFDTSRYYITNLLVFLVFLFKPAKPEESEVENSYPLVSVILPVYNEGDHIQHTIESILESDYPNYEVIIVDDGSSDNTKEVCRNYQRAGSVIYIRREERGGKPSALNMGFQFAKGAYIIHFDGEVIIYRDTIRKSLQPFSDPDVGVVSGNLKVANDKESLATRLQAAEYAMGITIQRQWLAWADMLQIASGAFSVFRRELMERVMGTDPETGEDLDITIKIKKLSYKAAFAANAHARTNVPKTFYTLFRQRIRWDMCFIRINLRKHCNILNLIRFKFSDFIAVISDITLNVIGLAAFPIYIAVVAIFWPQYLLFIITVTYLFYTVMSFVQLSIAVLMSNEPVHDIYFILLAPIYFFYTIFLKIDRTIAYVSEFLRIKPYNDKFLPKKVLDSQTRF